MPGLDPGIHDAPRVVKSLSKAAADECHHGLPVKPGNDET
jgi:hypothetical protein